MRLTYRKYLLNFKESEINERIERDFPKFSKP